MSDVVDIFSAEVHAAQAEFGKTMDNYWKKVLSGELSEADYWELAFRGEPSNICKEKIRIAVEKYDNSFPPPTKKSLIEHAINLIRGEY